MRSSRASRCRSRMTRLRSAAPAPCSRPRLVRAHGVACFTSQCNTSMSARLGLDITHLASLQWHRDVLREADRTRARAGEPGGYYRALESSCQGRAVHERGGANVCLPAACGARQCGTSNASCPRPRTRKHTEPECTERRKHLGVRIHVRADVQSSHTGVGSTAQLLAATAISARCRGAVSTRVRMYIRALACRLGGRSRTRESPPRRHSGQYGQNLRERRCQRIRGSVYTRERAWNRCACVPWSILYAFPACSMP